MPEYVAPELGRSDFHCPQPDCGVYAHQSWFALNYYTGTWCDTECRVSVCAHCDHLSYWIHGRLVDPSKATAPPPHPDTPPEILADYLEARDVADRSPRSACALLRLVLQKLCVHLGESGRNINDDIGALVAKGLPVQVQQALDSLRVFGNNAVHPGEIKLDDDTDTAIQLFGWMNFIVEQLISQPLKLHGLYDKLPQGAIEQISKRDGPAT